MNKRIKGIDGYRTLAVLGVLWAHVWTFFGNPPIVIFGANIAGLLSFGGNGVDLFFVISGFCMYLMYVSKENSFNIANYWGYLKKRFVRIAPAFYAAILVYSLYTAGFKLYAVDWKYNLLNAAFIRTLFAVKTQYAPHFWSLSTEWHFYLVLPFIVWGISKWGFKKITLICFFASLMFRAWVWHHYQDAFNIINYSIANRLIEFLMGMIIARLFLQRNTSWLLNSKLMLPFGALLAFGGKVLLSAYFHDRNDTIGYLAKIFDLPLLSFGFAILIINSLNVSSWFSQWLESGVMSFLGKISYSMYLWHWIVAEVMMILVKNYVTQDPLIGLMITFFSTVLLLIPISRMSYILFESFYFARRK